MTKSEFYNQICDLPNQFKNKDLKTYLLSLLSLVYNRKDKPMNADILLDMLKSAFFEDPVEFDNEWLKKMLPLFYALKIMAFTLQSKLFNFK